MFELLRQHLAFLTITSIVLQVVGTAVALIFIIRMPADYFISKGEKAQPDIGHTLMRVTVRIVKNVLGVLVFLAGMVMAVPLVPGPGFLLILIGISLTDFPGKRSLELRIIQTKWVLNPINGLRAKFGRGPLLIVESDRKEIPPRKLRGYN